MTMYEAARYCKMTTNQVRNWRHTLGMVDPHRRAVDMTPEQCDWLLAQVRARAAARHVPRAGTLLVLARTCGVSHPTARAYAIKLGLWPCASGRLTPEDARRVSTAIRITRAARHAASVERNRKDSLRRYHARRRDEWAFLGVKGHWERVG